MGEELRQASVEEAIAPLRAALQPSGASAIVVAPPGSGKTTRLPIALLNEPWLEGRRIVLLEPRRLATRAAARRMADLLGESAGHTVGFTTRDERCIGPGCRIEVVTEGVLTRRLQNDPELPGTALVIFDEIHERNLQTDLGLALALDTRQTIRPDLRLCAMSATIVAEGYAQLLGADERPTAVITAGGAPFPVETRWFPRRVGERLEARVTDTVRVALRRESGDALVFLPGAREINRVAEMLADLPALGIDVLRLYGALGADEQDRALQPSPPGRRRVVLATDIAESSLTVDGVRVVVDSGLARAPRFDPRTGMTRLETVSISRASADQRAGRAGRQGPGEVYRLWSKGEHATRRTAIEPEIRQVDLAGFALELAAWGTPDPARLRFLDSPPAATYADAQIVLAGLGLLDADGRITPDGRAVNDLPLHPRLAVMVQRAGSPRRTALACAVAALLEERDVMRGRPDELPADLGTRLALVGDRDRRHPSADGRAVATARSRTEELMRRVGCHHDLASALITAQPEEVGELLAVGYPDRVATRRNQQGRFQLPSGTAAWVNPHDALADAPFVIAADLDGDRREARIRLGAPIGSAAVSRIAGAPLIESTRLEWDDRRDELVEYVERRLGAAVVERTSRKPEPGPFVVDALVERVRRMGPDRALTWSTRAESLRARSTMLGALIGPPWPDWSWPALTDGLDEWLAPFLLFARGRGDLDALDPGEVLRAGLDPRLLGELDALAPAEYVTPAGRRLPLDYSEADPTAGRGPTLAARVQDLFGVTTHPTVAGGRLAVVAQLLSPAGRPLQITADLPGFWAGSWSAVRKEMAGRYPKHAWPADPARAKPPERR